MTADGGSKIPTEHPQPGKSGVNISREKYELIRSSILSCLEKERELTYTQLTERVGERLDDNFEGSVMWYVEVVKLDLEAKRVIERIESTRPQRYRLTAGSLS